MAEIISVVAVERKIYHIRGRKVILDEDLARLYAVETKYLTRQVRRNPERFPEDFQFQLTKEEFLRCQKVTSKRGGRRYLPYAFTEQGIAMLSSVLNSKRAILVNIQIMRVFVKLREVLIQNKEFTGKLCELERRIDKHDAEIRVIFEAIKQLLEPPPVEENKPAIGFRS